LEFPSGNEDISYQEEVSTLLLQIQNALLKVLDNLGNEYFPKDFQGYYQHRHKKWKKGFFSIELALIEAISP